MTTGGPWRETRPLLDEAEDIISDVLSAKIPLTYSFA